MPKYSLDRYLRMLVVQFGMLHISLVTLLKILSNFGCLRDKNNVVSICDA